MKVGTGEVRAPEAADWALARGRPTWTTPELAQLLGVPHDQVRRRLHAPAGRGEWVTPIQGLWIAVPPEFRTWGAPPGIEIVDAMMGHLNINYYVGWLTAASRHGAAHQAPQVFQVAVNRHVRNRTVGRTRFDFAQRSVDHIPVIEQPTRSGTARISTVAATMLDIAADMPRAGGPNNAATVIIELSEHDQFDTTELVHLAGRFPAAAARRVGFILDHFAGRDDLHELSDFARSAAHSPSRLSATGVTSGPVDSDWMLYINRDLEPDV
ncbi:type IV toxin-antitoxin system AbiEi family antitoxin domain-containing protein [Pseudactinotalea sp. Z1748]|uniref:type IV toxin-antitoxin system AbiEi family antitoxin domain-containing protein n=1 Tax=Pseudactinotalea sp. Z1748 TaxID=3413027 RepID=UPI003C7CF207